MSSLLTFRACEQSGAERAKYSQSAERVFNQRPERSLCLALVPLRYRSHHESRACKNPPRMLRDDFPFCAYVNRLEQSHCLRNTRISGVKRICFAAVTQQTRSTSAKQAVCPRRFIDGILICFVMLVLIIKYY